jgi:hypothetical protein
MSARGFAAKKRTAHGMLRSDLRVYEKIAAPRRWRHASGSAKNLFARFGDLLRIGFGLTETASNPERYQGTWPRFGYSF